MNTTTKNSRRTILIFFIVTLGIAVSVTAYKFTQPDPQGISPTRIPTALQSVLWPEPKPLPEFALVDHSRQDFTRQQLLGRWTFLFFGYTSCPDVCPTTLAILQAVAEQVSAPTGMITKPQYVFVSVDPQRDTPERLRDYVKHFNSEFIGVTGTEPALAALAPELYVLYERADVRSADDYDVNHTASVLLIDPQARLFGRFSPPHVPSEITAYFAQLRAHYQRTSRR